MTSRRVSVFLLATIPLALSLISAAPAADEAKAKEGWISLFNGKDLEGWTPKITGYPAGENYGDTFRVENGVLKVAYDKYSSFDGKFGHLFYKSPFSSYKLHIEYRFVGDQCKGGPGWAIRNSGAMIYGQTPESMRIDQDFPVSIEVQFLGGNGKEKRSTGNVCTPGTHVVMKDKLIKQHCIDSSSKTFHGDQWVTIDVETHADGSTKHFVNGELVIEYQKPQLDDSDKDAVALMKKGQRALLGGTISLQSESHPIEFRKVELLPLKD